MQISWLSRFLFSVNFGRKVSPPENTSLKFTPSPIELVNFYWEENLVAPLIAAPNGEMRKWEDKGTEHKCLTTGYACNCNVKEITILFCKQIGQSPNTSYAKCRMGLREGKMEMVGSGFSSHPIFVS
jgi:hypothetical protein